MSKDKENARRGRPPKLEGKLAQWIEKSTYTREEIAKKLGINRHYLDHLCRGTRGPSLKIARAIQELTEGEVSMEYLVDFSQNGIN